MIDINKIERDELKRILNLFDLPKFSIYDLSNYEIFDIFMGKIYPLLKSVEQFSELKSLIEKTKVLTTDETLRKTISLREEMRTETFLRDIIFRKINDLIENKYDMMLEWIILCSALNESIIIEKKPTFEELVYSQEGKDE